MTISTKKGAPTIEFPPLALGTWTFAGDAIWSESDEKECVEVIHRAMDLGITLFDTSPDYGAGRSEEILGKGLAGIPAEKALVATKMKIDGKNEKDIVASVERSLRRLNRDALDLMQVHWPGTPEETKRALDCFLELQSRGKIREIGACNFGIHDLEETADYPIVSNQLPYSLLWRAIENAIAPLSKAQGKRIWAYSTFQQGLLSGKYPSLEDFPEGRKRTLHFSSARPAAGHGGPGMETETETTLKAFLELSRTRGITPLALAMGFVSSRPFIDSLVVGARTPAQIEGLVRESKTVLNEGLLAELDALSEGLKKKAGNNLDMFQSPGRVRS